MASQPIRQALGDLDHAGLVALDSVDSKRKIERLLYRPNPIVPIGGKQLRRIADGNPADRHGFALFQPRAEMDHRVDANFTAFADPCAMKDRSASGDED